MNIYSLDIESNNLLSESIDFTSLPYKLKKEAKLWVVSILNIETKEKFTKIKEEITREWLQEILSKADVLVLHNGHRFDLIMLQLFGLLDYKIGNLGEPDYVFNKKCRIIDTLILSRYLWPDRPGFHSLKSWGKRVKLEKIDFRQVCIDKGYIEQNSPQGEEFKQYCFEMKEYCENDCLVTGLIYQELIPKLKNEHIDLTQGFQQEQILSNYGLWASTRGFYFGKELALTYVDDLINKMQVLSDSVTPLLPPKKLNKGELKEFTPPKIQLTKDNQPSSHLKNFANKHNATLYQEESDWFINYKGIALKIPLTEQLETTGKADISDLDHVKQTLLNVYGWEPQEFRERDLTKDSKKNNLPYQKRIATLRRYVEETLEGKYKKQRLEILGIAEDKLYTVLAEKLKDDKPVRVPVSPLIRLSGSKELDPNLIKLGEKAAFAKDFADYLTYRHRRSSIAGGDVEDIEWDAEHPNTGYLSIYREEDHRIPTNCIEIGTNCVTADTEIITFNGLKKITEVCVGDKVLTHSGVYREVIDTIENGIKDVWTVTLENGLSLRCTENHPFWTERGWVRCQHLQDEDRIYHYGEKEVWVQHPEYDKYIMSSYGRIKEEFELSNITSIVYSGRESTYDLTVEEDHSYVANSIVTHNTFRMKHIGCANIPRVSSQYGYEMRSLFRAAPKECLFGYDFSSLENRILGAAVYKYNGGKEMAHRLIADKPNDLHTVLAEMLGITRDEAKSVNYGIAFGAQPAKLSKMLNCTLNRAKEIYNGYWEMNFPLQEYKQRLEKFWESTGKKYVVALDRRKVYIRSKHSIINAITQANGAIFGKYVAIFIMEELTQKYNMNPFKSVNLPINQIITYHDEQIYNIADMNMVKFKTFETEESAVEFIKNWDGEHQLGGLCHDKKWYVSLPNELSIAVENSIKRAEKLLNLPVEMGFEYKIGTSWASIH